MTNRFSEDIEILRTIDAQGSHRPGGISPRKLVCLSQILRAVATMTSRWLDTQQWETWEPDFTVFCKQPIRLRTFGKCRRLPGLEIALIANRRRDLCRAHGALDRRQARQPPLPLFPKTPTPPVNTLVLVDHKQ